MKKYIILILLFAVICSAPYWPDGETDAWMGPIMLSGSSSSSSSSSGGACSGNLAAAQGSTTTTTEGANEPGLMYYTRVTAGATGYANTAVMRTRYGGETELLWMAVYDTDGALLAEITPIAATDAAADVSGALDSTICIESGVNYYLAFEVTGTEYVGIWRVAQAGNNIWKVTNTYANGPPATINPGTDGVEYAGAVMNIRVTYQ